MPTVNNITVLPNIIELLASNYVGISIVSIMNMEPKGLARKNYSSIYTNVEDQLKYLESAVDIGELYGMSIRLFNYPYCLLSESLKEYSVKSISDWKNYYPETCSGCQSKAKCGGFFTSSTGKLLEQVRVN